MALVVGDLGVHAVDAVRGAEHRDAGGLLGRRHQAVAGVVARVREILAGLVVDLLALPIGGPQRELEVRGSRGRAGLGQRERDADVVPVLQHSVDAGVPAADLAASVARLGALALAAAGGARDDGDDNDAGGDDDGER